MTDQNAPRLDPIAIAMGLAFALMWSSAFTSARVIVQDAPPITALGLRFLLSGLIGVGIALALGQPWRLPRAQIRALMLFGVLQNVLYLGLNFVAMQTVEASLAAIIASLMPLLVAFFGWIWMGERPAPLGLLGLVMGTFGAVVILAGRFEGGAPVFGIALCGAGVLALTFATLLVKGATSPGTVLMSVALQMLFAAVILLPLGLAVEELTVTWSWTLGFAFVYTMLVPGLLATFTWFLLVGRVGAVPAATYHFLNPFFGVVIAWALLGEALTWRDGLGVLVIAAGIYAVQISRRAKAAPTAK